MRLRAKALDLHSTVPLEKDIADRSRTMVVALPSMASKERLVKAEPQPVPRKGSQAVVATKPFPWRIRKRN